MQVERLPVLSDNYIFMLLDPEQRTAAVVDPAIASPVLHWLRSHSFNLIAIFNTHHHSDHVGGNAELLRHYPAIPVYAGAEDRGRIPGQTVFLQEGDRVQFGHWQGTVFFVPGHTRSHIAYYFPPVTPEVAGDLFCGDTLFAGGCGRLFEGSPAQMVSSLAKLRQLPGHTQVWCAHEYTLKNLRFALSVEPDNVALQDRYQLVQAQRSRQESTIPSMLEVEKHTNPFLRWDVPSLQQVAAAPGDGIKTFAYLRQARDHW